jgi:hypothetical protein
MEEIDKPVILTEEELQAIRKKPGICTQRGIIRYSSMLCLFISFTK